MSDNKIVKEYKNDEIVVTWQPHMCTHAKHCWKDLGKVFKPLKRPWVKMDGATSDEIIAQVQKCPSGALSVRYIDESKKIINENKMEDNNNTPESTEVKIIPNGPLQVLSTCTVTHADGSTETKENRASFCRCGASANKPYCDGGHRAIEWKG